MQLWEYKKVWAVSWKQESSETNQLTFHIIINTKPQADHPVDTASMNLWVIKCETRGQKRCFVQQHDKILHGLVILVSFNLLPQGLNDWVIRINFKMFLCCHIPQGAVVTKGLSLHDPFHVRGPSKLTGYNAAGRRHQTTRHHYFLYLLVQDFLDCLQKLKIHFEHNSNTHILYTFCHPYL